MVKVNEKQKHREAGVKAWKTIRTQKRKEGALCTGTISAFSVESKLSAEKPQQIEKAKEWAGNKIVMPFDKTPSDIACGRFWELRWAYGCPYNCSYCFLRGTLRGQMKPRYVRTELVMQALDEAFGSIPGSTIFNTGELSDSLMNPPLMEPIVNKFEKQKAHKVFLLSKSGASNIQFLLKEPRRQTICCWSINALDIAEMWEQAAAKPADRIHAASLVSEVGYDTRIRIDPIFPIENWKEKYSQLLDLIFRNLIPNRIILGTPRGLWKTLYFAKNAQVNVDWIRFFGEDSSWGKKIAFPLRKEIYQFFFDELESKGFKRNKISICKETLPMWESLGMLSTPKVCNCYGSKAY